MKILLIQPPARSRSFEPIVMPPLGLAYLAAVVRQQGYDVSLLDAFALGLSWREFEAAVRQVHADVIGLSTMTPTIDVVVRAAAIAKSCASTLVLGGPHATVYKHEMFTQIPAADFVVAGEGERTFLELIQCLDAGKDPKDVCGLISRTAEYRPRPLIMDLDTLPFPARDMLPRSAYSYILAKNKTVTSFFSSRGCPYQCIFCDKSVFGSQYRLRSAGNVLAELGEIADTRAEVSVVFYDDLFTFDRARVIAICEGILDRGLRIDWKAEARVDRVDKQMLMLMKKAGCSTIAFGVESGNQHSLDYLRKNTKLGQITEAFKFAHDVGIKTMAYAILGLPVEDREQAKRSVRFIKKLRPSYVQFSVLSPMPGTDLYKQAKQDNTYQELDAQNPVDKDIKRPVVVSRFWDEKSLREILRFAYFSFYASPAYLARMLGNGVFWRRALSMARIFLNIVKWRT